MIDALHEASSRVAKASFGAWCRTFAWIKRKDTVMDTLKPNALQRKVIEAYEWCQANGIPFKAIIYKIRQCGGSTVSVLLTAYSVKRYKHNAMIVGGKTKQTQSLWNILTLCLAKDTCNWGVKMESDTQKAICSNGGFIRQETAGDSELGRAFTLHVVVATEFARWKDTPSFPVDEKVNGLVNGIVKGPNTVTILESTTKGPFGAFYRYWMNALSFEDFQQRPEHDRGNGFIRIFAGWMEFEENTLELTPAQEREVLDGVGAIDPEDYHEEQRIIMVHGATPGQIAWRRKWIREECQGKISRFNKEFPLTPESGFEAASSCKFDGKGLKRMLSDANAAVARLEWGTITRADPDDPKCKDILFTGCVPKEADVCIADHPTYGMSYLVSVDNMKSAVAVQNSTKADGHAVTVWRQGYMDASSGQYYVPKIVATSWRESPNAYPGPTDSSPAADPRCQCRIFELAELVDRLSNYYGGCVVVPERNNDCGLIADLLDLETHLYRPEPAKESDSNNEEKKAMPYGFNTNEQSRTAAINRMDRAVMNFQDKNHAVSIPFPWIVAEMHCLVVDEDDDGRAEAMTGKHDDWVMASVIGLQCLPLATLMSPPLAKKISRRPIRWDEVKSARGNEFRL